MTAANGGADPDARLARRWDVALSFAGAQRDHIGQVAAALTAQGVRCLYDADKQVRLRETHLAEELPGSTRARRWWWRRLRRLCSRDWTRLERHTAFSQAVAAAAACVLPAWFDDRELSGLLPDVVAVDPRRYTPAQFAEPGRGQARRPRHQPGTIGPGGAGCRRRRPTRGG